MSQPSSDNNHSNPNGGNIEKDDTTTATTNPQQQQQQRPTATAVTSSSSSSPYHNTDDAAAESEPLPLNRNGPASVLPDSIFQPSQTPLASSKTGIKSAELVPNQPKPASIVAATSAAADREKDKDESNNKDKNNQEHEEELTTTTTTTTTTTNDANNVDIVTLEVEDEHGIKKGNNNNNNYNQNAEDEDGPGMEKQETSSPAEVLQKQQQIIKDEDNKNNNNASISVEKQQASLSPYRQTTNNVASSVKPRGKVSPNLAPTNIPLPPPGFGLGGSTHHNNNNNNLTAGGGGNISNTSSRQPTPTGRNRTPNRVGSSNNLFRASADTISFGALTQEDSAGSIATSATSVLMPPLVSASPCWRKHHSLLHRFVSPYNSLLQVLLTLDNENDGGIIRVVPNSVINESRKHSYIDGRYFVQHVERCLRYYAGDATWFLSQTLPEKIKTLALDVAEQLFGENSQNDVTFVFGGLPAVGLDQVTPIDKAQLKLQEDVWKKEACVDGDTALIAFSPSPEGSGFPFGQDVVRMIARLLKTEGGYNVITAPFCQHAQMAAMALQTEKENNNLENVNKPTPVQQASPTPMMGMMPPSSAPSMNNLMNHNNNNMNRTNSSSAAGQYAQWFAAQQQQFQQAAGTGGMSNNTSLTGYDSAYNLSAARKSLSTMSSQQLNNHSIGNFSSVSGGGIFSPQPFSFPNLSNFQFTALCFGPPEMLMYTGASHVVIAMDSDKSLVINKADVLKSMFFNPVVASHKNNSSNHEDNTNKKSNATAASLNKNKDGSGTTVTAAESSNANTLVFEEKNDNINNNNDDNNNNNNPTLAAADTVSHAASYSQQTHLSGQSGYTVNPQNPNPGPLTTDALLYFSQAHLAMCNPLMGHNNNNTLASFASAPSNKASAVNLKNLATGLDNDFNNNNNNNAPPSAGASTKNHLSEEDAVLQQQQQLPSSISASFFPPPVQQQNIQFSNILKLNTNNSANANNNNNNAKNLMTPQQQQQLDTTLALFPPGFFKELLPKGTPDTRENREQYLKCYSPPNPALLSQEDLHTAWTDFCLCVSSLPLYWMLRPNLTGSQHRLNERPVLLFMWFRQVVLSKLGNYKDRKKKEMITAILQEEEEKERKLASAGSNNNNTNGSNAAAASSSSSSKKKKKAQNDETNGGIGSAATPENNNSSTTRMTSQEKKALRDSIPKEDESLCSYSIAPLIEVMAKDCLPGLANLAASKARQMNEKEKEKEKETQVLTSLQQQKLQQQQEQQQDPSSTNTPLQAPNNNNDGQQSVISSTANATAKTSIKVSPNGKKGGGGVTTGQSGLAADGGDLQAKRDLLQFCRKEKRKLLKGRTYVQQNLVFAPEVDPTDLVSLSQVVEYYTAFAKKKNNNSTSKNSTPENNNNTNSAADKKKTSNNINNKNNNNAADNDETNNENKNKNNKNNNNNNNNNNVVSFATLPSFLDRLPEDCRPVFGARFPFTMSLALIGGLLSPRILQFTAQSILRDSRIVADTFLMRKIINRFVSLEGLSLKLLFDRLGATHAKQTPEQDQGAFEYRVRYGTQLWLKWYLPISLPVNLAPLSKELEAFGLRNQQQQQQQQNQSPSYSSSSSPMMKASASNNNDNNKNNNNNDQSPLRQIDNLVKHQLMTDEEIFTATPSGDHAHHHNQSQNQEETVTVTTTTSTTNVIAPFSRNNNKKDIGVLTMEALSDTTLLTRTNDVLNSPAGKLHTVGAGLIAAHSHALDCLGYVREHTRGRLHLDGTAEAVLYAASRFPQQIPLDSLQLIVELLRVNGLTAGRIPHVTPQSTDVGATAAATGTNAGVNNNNSTTHHGGSHLNVPGVGGAHHHGGGDHQHQQSTVTIDPISIHKAPADVARVLVAMRVCSAFPVVCQTSWTPTPDRDSVAFLCIVRRLQRALRSLYENSAVCVLLDGRLLLNESATEDAERVDEFVQAAERNLPYELPLSTIAPMVIKAIMSNSPNNNSNNNNNNNTSSSSSKTPASSIGVQSMQQLLNRFPQLANCSIAHRGSLLADDIGVFSEEAVAMDRTNNNNSSQQQQQPTVITDPPLRAATLVVERILQFFFVASALMRKIRRITQDLSEVEISPTMANTLTELARPLSDAEELLRDKAKILLGKDFYKERQLFE